MKFSATGIQWAQDKWLSFSDMANFKGSEKGLRAFAEALLRIAHPVVLKKRYEWHAARMKWNADWDALYESDETRATYRKDHPYPKEPVLTDADWGASDEELEDAVVVHPKLGPVHPVDWLIETYVDKHRFAPTPADLRAIFSGPFECADGKAAEQISGPETGKGDE